MPRFLMVIMTVLGLIACGARGADAAEESGKSGDEGFVALFDGKTLDNWTAYTDGGEKVPLEESSWNVEEGVIHCSGKGPDYWLVPEGVYGDFVLKMDFKVEPKTNSGVFLRAPTPDQPAWKGFEIQIIDDIGYEPNKHSTGSIYDVLTPMRNMSKPIGEWNTLEMTCKGSKVKVVHNGGTVIHVDFAELTEPIGKFDFPYANMAKEGLIGVQNHGHQIWFKNVTIKKLK